MNDNPDPKLRKVLHAWEVSPQPAPDFQASVWRRIAAQEKYADAGAWVVVREWLFNQLPKPAYAVALFLVAAAGGVAVANTRAEHAREQYRVNAARSYLASIDPLAMMTTHSAR